MPGFELFDHAEREQLQDVMDTGILMRYGFNGLRKGHWKAKEMEAAIARTAGVRHALLLSSGTAALTTALAAMGVGAGDEVILPPFTFVASFESILATGAVPVMADIDDTLCLDPQAVRRAITPRTKVVMPVHMCGAMAQVDELLDICRQHGLFLLEDACQAFGASFQGKMLGSIGDAGCYSFDFNKIITCGEGGAVVTNDHTLLQRADQYHDHGHDHTNDDRGAEGHPFIGYNYRISELHAAIGCAQISKLARFVDIHRKHKQTLKESLADLPDIAFRRLPDPDGDSATFLSLFMPSEDLARRASNALKKAGIDGVFHWYDNNWHYIRKWEHLKARAFAHPLYKPLLDLLPDYATVAFPQSDDIIARTLSIAIKMGWSDDDVHRRATTIKHSLQNTLRTPASR
ncbi:MAG: DegT/DnrJ/EryC1/StrS family aminotransferase [Prevotellaceae bacterium]|jgi:8-amino-3,8-dideoxy-alpha-D-manno-octulosonate transaminase|nr:DegT/DnrJ/EryC1/StrS family aminotransferase [Prevotellaceae bacterium]